MIKDSLSALLDGECSGPELDQLLDELDRSPELAEQWSRLCLAREAGQGTRVKANQPCICADVMSQLDEAPAQPGAKVVDLAVHRASRGAKFAPLKKAWKPAVSLAAAASVGAAAVLMMRPAGLGTPASDNGFAATGQVARWAPTPDLSLRPVSLSDDAAHAQMLREYLIDHSNAVADEGMGGTLRFARFAAHTAEYRLQPDQGQ